jgi:predicted dehydrogenase
LLDLGVYPLSFAHDLLGAPVGILARGTMHPRGVDVSVATVMEHGNGAISTCYSTMESRGRNIATVLCTEGRIELDATWYTPTTVTVRDAEDEIVDRFERPVSGRGMQFQARELERLAAEGALESPLMRHDDTVAVMETLDRVREIIGLRYPGE